LSLALLLADVTTSDSLNSRAIKDFTLVRKTLLSAKSFPGCRSMIKAIKTYMNLFLDTT